MPRPAPAEPKVRVNITITPSLYDTLQAMAHESERPFSAQVAFMLKRAIMRDIENVLARIPPCNPADD
jgi:hypothetical protein